MIQRIMTGLGLLFIGLFATWVVANAVIDMKAPDITNDAWLNSTPAPF